MPAEEQLGARAANIAAGAALIVDWVAGIEDSAERTPEVWVDDQAVGLVDRQIRVQPGFHRVSVWNRSDRTNVLQCDCSPGRLVVLDYAEQGLRNAVVVLLLATLGLCGAGLIVAVELKMDEPYSHWVGVGIFTAVGAAANGIRRIARRHRTTLQFVGDDSVTRAEHGKGADEPMPRKVRFGRIVVVFPEGSNEPQKTTEIIPVKPPQARIIIDGRDAGSAEQVLRTLAGERRVRLRGWLMSTSELQVSAPAGGLIELEVGPRKLSTAEKLVAAVLVAGAAGLFWAIAQFELPDWSATAIGILGVGAIVAALVLARLMPTMRLEVKDIYSAARWERRQGF